MTKASDAWADDMGQRLSEWPGIKRRFYGLKPMVERAVALVNALPSDAVKFDTGNQGYQVLTDALAWYNEDDVLASQVQAWDNDFAEYVRLAIDGGNISQEEAASIGYGGLGDFGIVSGLVVFAVVAAVAAAASWYGKARIEAQEQAKVQIQQAVLAHERQAIKIKTAAEAWAAAYTRDHNIPYPEVSQEPGPDSAGPVSRAAASAIGWGTFAAIGLGVFVVAKKFGGRKK